MMRTLAAICVLIVLGAPTQAQTLGDSARKAVGLHARMTSAYNDALAIEHQDELEAAAKAAVWSSFLREYAEVEATNPAEMQYKLVAARQQTYWRAQANSKVSIEQPDLSSDLALYSSSQNSEQRKAIEEATAYNEHGNEYRPYDASRDGRRRMNMSGVVSSTVGSYGGVPYYGTGVGLNFWPNSATNLGMYSGYGSGYGYGSGFNTPYSVFSPMGNALYSPYGYGGYGGFSPYGMGLGGMMTSPYSPFGGGYYPF